MIIVAHRAQNQENIPAEFGIEVDLRDFGGKVYIGHDPIDFSGVGFHSMPFEFWLKDDIEHNGLRPLYCLNIKADGIERQVKQVIDGFPKIIENNLYFVFDMSYPSQRIFKGLGVPWAERVSEEEPYQSQSAYVWLDRWDWHESRTIHRSLASHISPDIYVPLQYQKQDIFLCAVSPELHDKTACPSWVQYHWQSFKDAKVDAICTDWFRQAQDFFTEI